MARKPSTEAAPTVPALPVSGGAYEVVNGQLLPTAPEADPASETAPETPIETGA